MERRGRGGGGEMEEGCHHTYCCLILRGISLRSLNRFLGMLLAISQILIIIMGT